jgi:tRNA (Thr-GGU) A37 N-methylase
MQDGLASIQPSRALEGTGEIPPVGVLAHRGPIRPNPIGLTLVELVKRQENVLWVRGLDTLGSTLVLDIKPYGHPSDIVVNFRALFSRQRFKISLTAKVRLGACDITCIL